MSTPLQFYRTFKALMAAQGIRHVLTSGMACVEYGIQQNTKDTDWIVHPDSLPGLVQMLCDAEPGLSGKNWMISYRSLFGAPLLANYLAAGWTSHLTIRDEPGAADHHLDFFGQPPRIAVESAFLGANEGIADLLVVAQMKKTDRDKDWPIVEALSQQAALKNEIQAILHTRDQELLTSLWALIPDQEREQFVRRRPLLEELRHPSHGLRKCLAAERALWEEVNRLRYRRFQHEWKEFLRRWRIEDDFAWPVSVPFARQHHLLGEAVQTHALPLDPLGGAVGRSAIFDQARSSVAEIFSPGSLLDAISPPLEEMLP